MNKLKTENIVENGISYNVSTYMKNKEYTVVWRNLDGLVDRLSKPAILIYTANHRLKCWIYFKNGKINSDHPFKAAVYFRSKNFILWNFKIWAKDGEIHRENKPAITILEKHICNKIFKALNGFFVRNQPCKNSKATLLFNAVEDNTIYENISLILSEFENHKQYKGYNLLNFDKKGKLKFKYRVVFSIKEELDNLLSSVNNINENDDYMHIEEVLFLFIRSLMTTGSYNFKFDEDYYYDLPQKVSLHGINQKTLTWLNHTGYHRDAKPALILWNNSYKEMHYYHQNKPKESIFKPFKTVINNNESIIDFQFYDPEINSFYKEEKLNPFQMNEEEKELVELNFTY